MKRKNLTRNALFTSVISLLLCVSMLVGTTFAWFTDEVVSGMNTIAAGNLDIELLANSTKVDSSTKLFDDVTLWEPGVVVYENLQVKNAGTLALKYQMTLNFGNENDLNGHKLSEVLKVVVLNKTIDGNATRAQVLQDAKAAAAASQGTGTLSNFYQTGTLEAGESSDAQAVVIYWDANDNATDNLYNANNGKITSDGKPLHIEFGVNLQATQKMSEEDSFGNDYDEFSSILPKATVNNVSDQYPSVKATDGIGGAASEIPVDFALQFLPNETLAEAESSAYRYWHADYVVKADKDIKANSVALVGYYKEWCQLNNNNWVSLTADQDIAANTEIRLVEMLGATVNYEEICEFGNDGTGFLCGAADLTGANAGTTITVELRMYETTIDPSNPSGSANVETGKYEVIGKYSYTFGGSWVNLEDGTVLFSDEDGMMLYDTQDVDAVDYTVPAGVTALGNYSFTYNTTIENVTLPSSVKDLGRAFDSNATIKKVVLNEGLQAISPRAFRATTALEEVEISSTVKKIDDDAFQKTGLTTITIPANVEYVGAQAFGASAIETVIFEGNPTIQNKAFRGCAALRTVYFNGDDVTFENTTGQANCWFCNSESSNPNTSDITFYVKNNDVAAKVMAAMGKDIEKVEIYVNGVPYEG